MSQCMSECQSTTCWRWFSPSAVWILELGSLGLTTSDFTHGAISTAQPESILCNGGGGKQSCYIFTEMRRLGICENNNCLSNTT